MSNKSEAHSRDPMEDRGWQQMKVLLDQEMPEKKRRMLWWYWAGAAAVFILGALLANTLLLRPASKIELVNPMVSQEREMQGNDLGQHEKINTEGQVELNGKNQGGTSKITSAKKDLDFSKKMKSKAQIVNKGAETNKTHSPEQNQVVSKPINELERKSKPSNIEADSEILNNEKSVAPTSIKPYNLPPETLAKNLEAGSNDGLRDPINISPLAEIIFDVPFQGVPAIDIDQSEIVLSSNDVNSIAIGKGKIDLALEVGVLSEPKLDKWSYDLGVQIRYSPIAKIALATGAYFWQINAQQEFTSRQPDLGFSAYSLNADNRAPEAMDTLSAVFEPTSLAMVDKLSYLRIPIFLHLFPNGMWQPRVGISQLFLISDGPLIANQERTNDLASSPNSDFRMVDDFVRKTNFSYEIGLTYQPGSHLYFDLSYRHGKRSYLNYSVTEGVFYRLEHQLRFATGYRF